MDRTFIPSPAPLVHGEHCFIYDATDPDSIRDAVEAAAEYLQDEPRRRALAEAGYAHVMAHHRGVNRVDAILKWLADDEKALDQHVKLASPWTERI